MKKPHVYTAYAFVVSTEIICIQDQLKVFTVTSIFLSSFVTIIEPVVVSGSGYAGNAAQFLDREDIVCIRKSVGDSIVSC